MNNKINIYIASDHAGYDLKQKLIMYLKDSALLLNIEDLGTDTADISVDYPDYADILAQKMEKSPKSYGILLCGSGIGISIAANRHRHIRAALCHNPQLAQLARAHNDANVLVLGSRFIDEAAAYHTLDIFLSTDFEGGRHQNRVDKI